MASVSVGTWMAGQSINTELRRTELQRAVDLGQLDACGQGRALEIGLDACLRLVVLGLGFGDTHGAVATTVLGRVQRQVGPVDGALPMQAQTGRRQREADKADRNRDAQLLLGADGDRRIGHGDQQAVGQQLHMRGLERRRHDEELLAAPAHQQIAFTQGALQALGDGLDDLVAGAMAMAVVDALEVVDVQHQQATGQRLGTARLHGGQEVAAVGQLRQRVALAQHLQQRLVRKQAQMGLAHARQRQHGDDGAQAEQQGTDGRDLARHALVRQGLILHGALAPQQLDLGLLLVGVVLGAQLGQHGLAGALLHVQRQPTLGVVMRQRLLGQAHGGPGFAQLAQFLGAAAGVVLAHRHLLQQSDLRTRGVEGAQLDQRHRQVVARRAQGTRLAEALQQRQRRLGELARLLGLVGMQIEVGQRGLQQRMGARQVGLARQRQRLFQGLALGLAVVAAYRQRGFVALHGRQGARRLRGLAQGIGQRAARQLGLLQQLVQIGRLGKVARGGLFVLAGPAQRQRGRDGLQGRAELTGPLEGARQQALGVVQRAEVAAQRPFGRAFPVLASGLQFGNDLAGGLRGLRIAALALMHQPLHEALARLLRALAGPLQRGFQLALQHGDACAHIGRGVRLGGLQLLELAQHLLRVVVGPGQQLGQAALGGSVRRGMAGQRHHQQGRGQRPPQPSQIDPAEAAAHGAPPGIGPGVTCSSRLPRSRA
ncbi:MAG: hypothetical protein U1E77_05670 [Inhella sp.]